MRKPGVSNFVGVSSIYNLPLGLVIAHQVLDGKRWQRLVVIIYV